ncbi:MAG: hypothetical protein P9F19_01410 [Candidatus Contendobacter sp.]|nr:hypothetical protein [Candidatus Contendobacter sp.]MDG4556047.1 hypothetical protein [Candidatus Contendobacter sp.]
MNDMISGKEALKLFGLQSPCGKPVGGKSIPATLQKYGVEIFRLNERYVLVKKEELLSALAKVKAEKSARNSLQPERLTQLENAGKTYRFVSNAETLKYLHRLEVKLDRLLKIWGESTTFDS